MFRVVSPAGFLAGFSPKPDLNPTSRLYRIAPAKNPRHLSRHQSLQTKLSYFLRPPPRRSAPKSNSAKNSPCLSLSSWPRQNTRKLPTTPKPMPSLVAPNSKKTSPKKFAPPLKPNSPKKRKKKPKKKSGKKKPNSTPRKIKPLPSPNSPKKNPPKSKQHRAADRAEFEANAAHESAEHVVALGDSEHIVLEHTEAEVVANGLRGESPSAEAAIIEDDVILLPGRNPRPAYRRRLLLLAKISRVIPPVSAAIPAPVSSARNVADEIAIAVAVAVRIVVVAVPIAVGPWRPSFRSAIRTPSQRSRSVHATTVVIAIPVRRAVRN